MFPQPNRITPALDVRAMKTYSVTVPPDGWRKATCAEYGCGGYLNGWVTRLPVGDALCDYIRTRSGRHFVETTDTDVDPETGLTTAVYALFRFDAGQQCFRADEHRVRADKPELYVVRDGDWRGNPTGRSQVIPSAQDWVDDMGEELDRHDDIQRKG